MLRFHFFQHLVQNLLGFFIGRSGTAVPDIVTHHIPFFRDRIGHSGASVAFRIVGPFPGPDGVTDVISACDLIENGVGNRVAAALADPDGHVVFQARIQEAVQGPDFR